MAERMQPGSLRRAVVRGGQPLPSAIAEIADACAAIVLGFSFLDNLHPL
jgi:hypothetical protein